MSFAKRSAASSTRGSRSLQRAVFLDRDGVLNHIVPRGERPGSPRHVDELVLVEEAAGAVARLRAAGYKTFIVTNQPDISRGLLSRETLDVVMAKVTRHVEVDDVRVCTHDDADRCACRKPRPGMLLELAEAWQIDLSASYMIGDTWKDMEASRAAGCPGILLRRPYNTDTQSTESVEDIDAAVDLILERERVDD